MKKEIILLILLFCVSCAQERQKNKSSSLNDSIPAVSLKGEFLSCDSIIWHPGIEAICNDHIIIKSVGDYIYDVYKISGKELIKKGHFLKKGSGPFEMNHTDLFKEETHNKLYISDYNGRIGNVYTIALNDINNLYDTSQWDIIHFPTYSNHIFFSSVAILSDSIWILPGSEINADNIISSINIKNGDMRKLDFKFPNIYFKSPGQRNIIEQMVYSDATLLKHPSQNKVLYICSSGRYAEILFVINENIEKRIPILEEYPKYGSRDGFNKHFKDECLRGMIARVTENRIFCLLVPLTKKDARENTPYKGYPSYYCDELLVFDWNGTLLNKFVLDMPVCSFITNTQGNIIYAMTLDDAEEYAVRRYIIQE